MNPKKSEQMGNLTPQVCACVCGGDLYLMPQCTPRAPSQAGAEGNAPRGVGSMLRASYAGENLGVGAKGNRIILSRVAGEDGMKGLPFSQPQWSLTSSKRLGEQEGEKQTFLLFH